MVQALGISEEKREKKDEELTQVKKRGRRPADPQKMRKNGVRINRKLISTGSTYLVSLPSVWVKEMGLEPGNLLSVIVHGEDYRFVSIVPSNIDSTIPKEATIHVYSGESAAKVFRKVVAAYVVGYERIYIEPYEEKSTLPREMRNEITKLARQKLFGIEISKNDPKLLKIMMYVDIRRPNETLEEMCDQAMSIYNGAIEKLVLEGTFKSKETLDAEKEALRDVEKSDDAVDRRHHHGTRSLKRALMNPRLIADLDLLNPRIVMGHRLVEKDVERIADHSERIAATYREYLSKKREMTKNHRKDYGVLIVTINEKSQEIKELFNQMKAALDKKGKEAFDDANDAIEFGEKLKTELKKAERQHKDWHHRRILESMRRIVEYIIGIGEIILNMHVNSVVVERSKQ